MDLGNDPEIVNDFLIESSEGLDALDGYLVALEAQPDDRETIMDTTGYTADGAGRREKWSRKEKSRRESRMTKPSG